MHSALDNLLGPDKPLIAEKFDSNEAAGLIRSGRSRLHDSKNTALSIESRFDLAYNAAHAFCLAALRSERLSPKTSIHRISIVAAYYGTRP